MPLQRVWEGAVFYPPNMGDKSGAVRILISNYSTMCIESVFEWGVLSDLYNSQSCSLTLVLPRIYLSQALGGVAPLIANPPPTSFTTLSPPPLPLKKGQLKFDM